MKNIIYLDKPEIIAYLKWYKSTTEGLEDFCEVFHYQFEHQIVPLQDHLGSYIEALDDNELFAKCWKEVFGTEF